MSGRLLSVNVAVPAHFEARGRRVRTGHFKEPVAGRIPLGSLGLEGDFQVDRRFHGGPEQAVYAYPSEHAAFWSKPLGFPGPVPPGWFGENFTTAGILETDAAIGDVYRVGSALVEITRPRSPCYKLGLKAGRAAFVRDFLKSGRMGFYLRVREEGAVGAGDPVDLVERPTDPLFVSELIEVLYSSPLDPDLLARAAHAGGLAPGLRARLLETLAETAPPL
jgi:MOSC domain-containing protein YiiM